MATPQKQSIFKCALFGVSATNTGTANTAQDISDQLVNFEYSLLNQEGNNSFTYTLELVITDDRLFDQIRSIYKLYYNQSHREGENAYFPHLPKLVLQWGYESDNNQHMSDIHVAQISDISYKFKDNREKIVQLTAVDLPTFQKTRRLEGQTIIPIYDSLGITLPGTLDERFKRMADKNLDNEAANPVVFKTQNNTRSPFEFFDIFEILLSNIVKKFDGVVPITPQIPDIMREDINKEYSQAFRKFLIEEFKNTKPTDEISKNDINLAFYVATDKKFFENTTKDRFMRYYNDALPIIFRVTYEALKKFLKAYFNVELFNNSKAKRFEGKYFYNSSWSKENFGKYGYLPLGPATMSRFEAEEIYNLAPQPELQGPLEARFPKVYDKQDLVLIEGGVIRLDTNLPGNQRQVPFRKFIQLALQDEPFLILNDLDSDAIDFLEYASDSDFFGEEYDFIPRKARSRVKNKALDNPSGRISTFKDYFMKKAEERIKKYMPSLDRVTITFTDDEVIDEKYRGKSFPVKFPVFSQYGGIDLRVPVTMDSELWRFDNDEPIVYSLAGEQINFIDKSEALVNKDAGVQKLQAEGASVLELAMVDTGVPGKEFSALSDEEQLELRFGNIKARYVIPEGETLINALTSVVKKHNDLFQDPQMHIKLRLFNTRSTPHTITGLNKFVNAEESKTYSTKSFKEFVSQFKELPIPPPPFTLELVTDSEPGAAAYVVSDHKLKTVNSFSLLSYFGIKTNHPMHHHHL